jgi:hypothetical protein
MTTYQAKATRRHRLRRREYIFEYKKQRSCVYCGQSNPLMLDLDHIDRSTKKGAPATMITSGHNWTSVLKEIDKCQVVCANCHRVKSVIEDGRMKDVDIDSYIPDNMRHLVSEDYDSYDSEEYLKSFTDKKRESEPVLKWRHDDGTHFTGTRYELRRAYPDLDIMSLRYIIEGTKQTQHKGWRLESEV